MKKSLVYVGIVLIGSMLGGITQFPSSISAANKELVQNSFADHLTFVAVHQQEVDKHNIHQSEKLQLHENENIHNGNSDYHLNTAPMIRQAREAVASTSIQMASAAISSSSSLANHTVATNPTNTVQLVGNTPLGQIATYHFSSDHELNLLSPSVTQEMLNNKDTGDLITGELLGSLLDRKDQAWVVLMYTETGHIFDYDHNQINSQRILNNYKDNIEQENEKYPNNPEIHIAGWGEEPSYNASTRTLKWELKITKGKDNSVVNDQARILTRTGYISAILVTDDTHFSNDHRLFEKDVLPNIHINPGSMYTDYNGDVDKDSKLTLEGLVLTGAGTEAAKRYGTFSIMNKLWFIVVPIIALFYWNHRNRSRREREHAQELEAVMYADHQSNELPMRRRPAPVAVSNKLETDSHPSRVVTHEVKETKVTNTTDENENSEATRLAVKEHTTMEILPEKDSIHHHSSIVTTEDSTPGDIQSATTSSYNTDSPMNKTNKN